MGVRMPPLNTNHTMDVNAVFRIAYNNHVIPVPELEVNGHFRFFLILKCRIGWQHCQTLKCTGDITNVLSVYAEL